MEEEQRVEGVLPSEEQLSVFLSYQLLSQRLPADLRQILRIDRTLAVDYQSLNLAVRSLEELCYGNQFLPRDAKHPRY